MGYVACVSRKCWRVARDRVPQRVRRRELDDLIALDRGLERAQKGLGVQVVGPPTSLSELTEQVALGNAQKQARDDAREYLRRRLRHRNAA